MNPKQRRENTRTIGEAIRELIEAYHLDKKLIETRIINAWGEVSGSYIASHTHKLYINDHILYVVIHSSVIKHELHLAHDDLLEQLNSIAGIAYLIKIVFV